MSTLQKARFLTITPRDPLIARDGRPFTAGNRMKSLDWFYPSVVAGSLRSILGKQAGVDFKDQSVHDPLRQVTVAGPVLLINEKLYLAAPHDLSFDKTKQMVFTARPEALQSGEGVDLLDGLVPAMLDLSPDDTDFKPADVPAFWSLDKLTQWLCCPAGQRNWPFSGSDYLKPVTQDQRFHVAIAGPFGTADDGMLFSTSGLDLFRLRRFEDGLPIPHDVQLVVRASASNGYGNQFAGVKQFHPLGGERRLVFWDGSQQMDQTKQASQWACPQEIATALTQPGVKHVRLVLASPGLFASGWRPDWIGSDRTGTVPGTDVVLKLVSVCVDRWKAISGWNLEKNQPRASQRVVPAGSVYFFEVISGELSQLATTWLQPTYDRPEQSQPARDGFGLALWGIWEPHALPRY